MRIDTILFDIDGVMLSEERYFDASALTVYELLYSPNYVGLDPEADGQPPFRPDLAEEDIRAIRRAVFADDAVLRMMKARGVNANWDMVYLQFAHQWTKLLCAWSAVDGEAVRLLRTWCQCGWTRDVLQHAGRRIRSVGVPWHAEFASFAADLASTRNKADLFAALEARLAAVADAAGGELPPLETGRALWNLGQETFQEWYLGDEYVPETRQPGKRGFLSDEIPIVDPAAFSRLLHRLRQRGIRLGIATGRPEIETRVPLASMGWLDAFHPSAVTTASDVLAAERAHPEAGPLAKPHPYSYLRSYLGTKGPESANDAPATASAGEGTGAGVSGDAIGRDAVADTVSPARVLRHPLPLPPEEAGRLLIVGDSVADALAARAIGCRFAAVLTGLDGEKARSQFESLGVDAILNDVLELPGLLGL